MICSPKEKNIAGQEFGRLTAIKRDFSKNKYNYWFFKCDCGSITSIRKSKGVNGYTKSCGCANNELDISNKKFNRLTAIERDFSKTRPEPYWLFKCECGEVTSVIKNVVMTGKVKSCGCWHRDESRERMVEMNTTHGLSGTNTYSIWQGIKDRCLNPDSAAYVNYGGRGITICDRWLDYLNFLEDMGDRPKDMSIDRINNEKGYSPDNCKWSTRLEQNNNRRTNRIVVVDGVEHSTVANAVRATGLTKAYITHHYL